MKKLTDLFLELDKLKSVYRKSYLSDETRNENSAEHSWHLAVSLMGFSSYLPTEVDLNKCMRMALCHDVCEIGAGDVCAYHDTSGKYEAEFAYMNLLQAKFPNFGRDALALWEEYEAGETLESKWVKVFDKLLPFILNLATHGRTWQEQNISKPMVLKHNAFIGSVAPDIHNWMLEEIEKAAEAGWLTN